MLLAGQTAPLGPTTLFTAPVDGAYLVHVYLASEAAVAAGTLSCTIGWTDTVAARTAQPAASLLLTGTGSSRGSAPILAAAGTAITFETALAGVVGSPSYTVNVTVQRI